MVRDRFDPGAFASIFTRDVPPEWAEQLIDDPGGRQLVYELASQHGHSVFLGWAIKRCLQLGHEAELDVAGPALAEYVGLLLRYDRVPYA
jgi:TH1 protein